MSQKKKVIILALFILSALLLISLYPYTNPIPFAVVKTRFFLYQVAVGSLIILIFIIVILYRNFGELMGKVIERDNQIQTINVELEHKISEQKEMQKELDIYRDYLEHYMLEGALEFQAQSQAIEISERKFRSITSSIRDAIIMSDEEGKVSFWNKSAERIFGYSAEEIRGKELHNIIIPHGKLFENENNFELLKKTNDENVLEDIIELEVIRKDGSIFPVEITLSVVNIQQRANTVAVIRDITYRKEAERERRILSSAVEQTSVVIVITNTDGVIEYLNPKFTEITGYSREEVLGKKPNLLRSGIHTEEFYKALWDTITSGKNWCGEFCNKKKSGELYWESSQICPIKDSQGRITHFVAFKEDVTARKQMELELVNAQKAAEAASESKSEFLANMSHELRTPMNAIIGMTELVLDTRITEEQQEYLNMLRQASNSLLNLLNDILDLSKIEAGKLILEPTPFNLRELVGETARTQGLEAHQKNLELIYYIDSDIPEQLIGDMSRLRQIIVNLLHNSIKFTEKGEIVLKIEIMEEMPGDKLKLHFLVSDTGIGIPEDKLHAIFEKFFQADNSITRKYGGSGLGLAITASLVGFMEGNIWAESPATFHHFNKSDPGSTFHFTAVFEIDKSIPAVKRIIDPDKLKGLQLLIVDDNKTNRRFLQEIFLKYGIETVEACSGQETLRLLKEKTFQLLILDYQMPEMDGGKVLETLRKEFCLDIPVILISSGIKNEEMDYLKQLGVSAHFLKPVNTRELLESITATMGYEIKITKSQKEPIKKNDKEETRKNLKKAHILVAEDNLINQRLIKRLLEKAGHTVDIANDGREALEKFNWSLKRTSQPGNHYNIILMDIQMPVMDGVQATREIRKQDPYIPIIALTAYAMKGDKSKFLATGMNDYISKPIKKSLLYELVDKYIFQEEE
ncbi:MAG TPA: PAS domain S-box protein [Candidatus Deferrimicrobium sp.]|nr:PAS domain S-box protein [Candidatus Deferrimicrobium sp.]